MSTEQLPIMNQTRVEETIRNAVSNQRKENKSPEHTEKNCTSSFSFQVPSRFKSFLFWPENKKTENKKKSILKVPSVATSEQWNAYYKNKQEAKYKKEDKKENRKRRRQEKLKNKLTKTKKRVINCKNTSLRNI